MDRYSIQTVSCAFRDCAHGRVRRPSNFDPNFHSTTTSSTTHLSRCESAPLVRRLKPYWGSLFRLLEKHYIYILIIWVILSSFFTYFCISISVRTIRHTTLLFIHDSLLYCAPPSSSRITASHPPHSSSEDQPLRRHRLCLQLAVAHLHVEAAHGDEVST